MSFFFDEDAAGVVEETLVFLFEGVLVDNDGWSPVEERCICDSGVDDAFGFDIGDGEARDRCVDG